MLSPHLLQLRTHRPEPLLVHTVLVPGLSRDVAAPQFQDLRPPGEPHPTPRLVGVTRQPYLYLVEPPKAARACRSEQSAVTLQGTRWTDGVVTRQLRVG